MRTALRHALAVRSGCGPLWLQPGWQKLGDSASDRAHVSGSRFFGWSRCRPCLARPSRVPIAGCPSRRVGSRLWGATGVRMHGRLAFIFARDVRSLDRRIGSFRLTNDLALKVFDLPRHGGSPFPAQRQEAKDVPAPAYGLICHSAAEAAPLSVSSKAQALSKLAVASAMMSAAVTDNFIKARHLRYSRPQPPAAIGVHPKGRRRLTIGFPDGAACAALPTGPADGVPRIT